MNFPPAIRRMGPIIALAIFAHTALGAGRVIVTLAAIKLGAPTFAVGMLLALYSFFPMLSAVLAGRWIDRDGTRTPMLLGFALLALGTAAPALELELSALYVASVMAGMGFLLVHLPIQKLTGEAVEDQADMAGRTRNFGWIAVAYSISGFVGPLLAGYAIEYGSFRTAFLSAAAVGALGGGLLYLRWRFPHQPREPKIAPEIRVSAFSLLELPQLRRLFVAVVMLSSAWDVHLFLVPIQGAKLGLSPSEIGQVLAAFGIATFLIRLVLPLINRRVTEWRVINSALWIAVGVFAAYPLMAHAGALMTLSFVLGLGLGGGQPMVMSLLHRHSPEGRIGEAAGVRQTLIAMTQTALPVAFGSVGSFLGLLLGGPFTFAPLFWGFAGLIGWGAWSGRKKQTGLPEESGK